MGGQLASARGMTDVLSILPKDDGVSGMTNKGLQRRDKSRSNIKIRFLHRHMQDTIIIMEEENHHHFLFSNCEMFVP